MKAHIRGLIEKARKHNKGGLTNRQFAGRQSALLRWGDKLDRIALRDPVVRVQREIR